VNGSTIVGIVGAGSMAFNSHVPVLRAMGIEVRWVLDADETRARKLAAAFELPLAFSASDLARTPEVDVLLLACPYGVRLPYYEFLRDRRPALYVEKPVAHSVAELERICSLRPDYALAAGFLRRSYGVTNIVKGLIEDRLFGDLRRVRSEFGTAATISTKSGFAKRLSMAGGGQLFESAIHDIDAVCYAAAVERARVLECRMEAEGEFDLETEARIELTDARGRRFEMELLVTCFRSTRYEIEMEFDQATVTFSLFRKTPPRIKSVRGNRTYHVLDPALADRPKSPLEMLYVFWRDYLDGLRTRRANYTSARTTAATTSVIEQLYGMGLHQPAAANAGGSEAR
jgi:UDP-N-acetyl-2-amino-2-deoxyglucuronate dehydrogenase